MKTLLDMRGIVTVLNTPFAADGTLDLTGLRQNVCYALEAGVAGFLVPALAGEVGKLTEAERCLLVETVLSETAGRAPVIGGASAPTGEERVRLARRYIDLGCPGILAALPFTNETVYADSVRELAALAPEFLMIQDWDPSGFGVPVEVVARLFEEIECFRCLKIEVVPAGVKYSQILEATGGRLHVSGGWAVTQMIEGLDRGVHAFMPTGMHRAYAHTYRRYAKGDRSGALELFNEIAPVLAFSNQHLDISIHFFKRLLHAQGIYATAGVRPPILPFDAVHERHADMHIAKVIAIEERLACSGR